MGKTKIRNLYILLFCFILYISSSRCAFPTFLTVQNNVEKLRNHSGLKRISQFIFSYDTYIYWYKTKTPLLYRRKPKHHYYTGKKNLEKSLFWGGGADLLFTQRFQKCHFFFLFIFSLGFQNFMFIFVFYWIQT